MNYKQEQKLTKKVNSNILMQANSLVEDLFTNNLITWDEFDNVFYNEELEELKEELENVTNEEEAEMIKEEIQEIEDNQYPREVMEWYFVNRYFYQELQEKGCIVASTDYGYIWGRTCTGQSIILDSVIQEIFDK